MGQNKLNIIELLLRPYFECFNEANEYLLNLNDLDGNKIPTMFFPHPAIFQYTLKTEKYSSGKLKNIIPRKVLNKANPNNMDNVLFWQLLHTKYKLVPVCGIQVKDFNEANNFNFRMSYQLGVIEKIEKVASEKSIKIFEIGYGYGYLPIYLNQKKDNLKSYQYFGVDIIKRMNWEIPNALLLENDGWEVPDEIEDETFDFIYSINVFQHLSIKQRKNYLYHCYDKLKNGGIMFFSCFIMTKDNKNEDCWGLVDEYGRTYCHHFSQMTEVDTERELKIFLKKIGYTILTFRIDKPNFLFVEIQKNILI